MPTFQVLFSSRTRDAVQLDGMLDDGEVVRPATIVGVRGGDSMLDIVIPATLDRWADDLEVVDVRETPTGLELSAGGTRVRLHPSDARA